MAGRKVKQIYHPSALPELSPQDGRCKRVAAYARVSTASDEQMNSVEAQKDYFTQLIMKHPGWRFAGLYADEGITGTSTRQREAFKQMIEDAIAGKIDLILTKSISRFARNTVDTLNTIRSLKACGVEVFFEKENIYTLDSKGEFLITLLSGIAEEESRTISENVKWGHRKAFQDGRYSLPYKHFLGYRKGADGKPEIIPAEATTIRWIYYLFLEGYSTPAIAKILTATAILTPRGLSVWDNSTVRSILSNEKYYGAALLQKTYSTDCITHTQVCNHGELPMYFIENDHPGIVSKEVFEEVQIRLKNKTRLCSSYTLFSHQICCPICGSWYGPKKWHSTTYNNVVWECNRRYQKENPHSPPHLYEELLIDAFREITHTLLEENHILDDCLQTLMTITKAPNLREIDLSDIYYADYPEESERATWLLIIDKVVPTAGSNLTFYVIDGTTRTIPMQRTTLLGYSRITAEERADIIQDYLNGVTSAKIAQMHDRPVDTIRSIIQRAKAPNKKRKCNPKKCLHCGKTFYSLPSAKQKYCCRECFLAERFGNRIL